jgi:DNA-directed RNA polymerase specialized sigma24 family protein
LKRYHLYARNLGPDAEIGDQLRLANDLVWPLARSVFLMHCVDELSYAEIATLAGVDIRTVEVCIGDAVYSMAVICDEFEETAG